MTKRNSSFPVGYPREQSTLTAAAAILLGLWFVIFPYRAGLFNGSSLNFEKPILHASLYAGLLLLAVSAVVFIQRKHYGSFPALVASVWAIPLCYSISSFVAVNHYAAQWLTYNNVIIAAIFTVAAVSSVHEFGRRIVEYSIVGTGYIVVFWGLLNVFGLKHGTDALWEAQPGQFRLTSAFQYSNAYAALLIALFLVALYYSSHVANRIWRSLHVLMLVPIFISFILTLSRAALLLLPVLILVILPFLRLSKQFLLLFYMIVTISASFIILSRIDNNMLEIATSIKSSIEAGNIQLYSLFDKLSWTGWLPLLAVSVVLAAMSWFGHNYLEQWISSRMARIEQKRWAFFAVPAALIVLLALFASLLLGSSAVHGLLPPSITDRIANIDFNQHSVLERGTFFKDAMKVSADYPLLGAGGGGWAALFQQYQHNPYVSFQAHNYFIQVLVETGWIGLIVHLSVILCILYLYIRSLIRNSEKRGSHIVFFIVALTILSHSMLDFDMSYIYLLSLVFASLGVLTSVINEGKSMDESKAKSKLSNKRFGQISLIYPSVLAIISIVSLVYIFTQLGARANYEDALVQAHQGKPFNDIVNTLDKAIDAAPAHPVYTLSKIDLLMDAYSLTKEQQYLTDAGALLDRLYPTNPYNDSMLISKYKYELASGNEEAALSTLEERILKFKWNIIAYSDAMHEYVVSGWHAGNQSPELRDKRWNRVEELHQEILRKSAELKDLPEGQLQGREFGITTAVAEALGHLSYLKGDYAQTIEWVKPAVTGDLSQLAQDASLQEAVRIYLAALTVTGQPADEGLLNQLLMVDLDTESKINELVALTHQ